MLEYVLRILMPVTKGDLDMQSHMHAYNWNIVDRNVKQHN